MTNTTNLNYQRKQRAVKIVSKVSIYTVLCIFALWVILPFSIIISTSLKSWQEANTLGFSFIPKVITFEGYNNAITHTAYEQNLPALIKGFINTLIFVIPTTIIGLLTSSMAGFSFAKINFKGKKAMFGFLIVTMLIPGTILIAPSYVMFDYIRWVDTPLPIIIPGMFGAAMCVFFMRQFYMGIPTDLVEAARVDGMSYTGIFFKIMVPLSKPALIAQAVLGFMGGYNDYFNPYIYLQSPQYHTVQIALREFAGTYSSKINTLMAGSIVVLVPAFIIYIFAQRYFVEGIATTGMKL